MSTQCVVSQITFITVHTHTLPRHTHASRSREKGAPGRRGSLPTPPPSGAGRREFQGIILYCGRARARVRRRDRCLQSLLGLLCRRPTRNAAARARRPAHTRGPTRVSVADSGWAVAAVRATAAELLLLLSGGCSQSWACGWCDPGGPLRRRIGLMQTGHQEIRYHECLREEEAP